MKKIINVLLIVFSLLIMMIVSVVGVLEGDISTGINNTFIAGDQIINNIIGVQNNTDVNFGIINGSSLIIEKLNVTDIILLSHKITFESKSDNGLWNDSLVINTGTATDDSKSGIVIIDNTTNLPYVIFKPVFPELASIITGSLIITSQEAVLNTTNATSCKAHAVAGNYELKVDCNSSSPSFIGTGADLIMEGDIQANQEVWIRDTDGDWHFMTRELNLRDELFNNITLSGLNGTFDLINSNLSISTLTGENIVVNVNRNESILSTNNESIILTSGTNSSPILNQVFYKGNGVPSLDIRTRLAETSPTVATFLLGSNFTYASAIGLATGNNLIGGLYGRFLSDGSTYKSGFGFNVSTTEINITTGVISFLLSTINIIQNHSTNFYAHVHSDGSFHQHTNLDDCSTYNNGASISNNRYFNTVFGIAITHDGVGVMYAVTQDEPTTEYIRAIDAEIDTENTVNFFPPDDIVSLVFVPIVRVVMRRSGGANTIQTLSSGDLFIDLRGAVTKTASSPPPSGITVHSDLSNLDFASALHTGFGSSTDINTLNSTKLENGTDVNFGIANSTTVITEKINLTGGDLISVEDIEGDNGHIDLIPDQANSNKALRISALSDSVVFVNPFLGQNQIDIGANVNITDNFNICIEGGNCLDDSFVTNGTDVSFKSINTSIINITGNSFIGGNLIIDGDIGLSPDTDLVQLLNGEFDVNGDILATGTIFADNFQGAWTSDGGVAMTSPLESFIRWTATTGVDNTDITFDLDGTRPRMFSNTDDTIEITDKLIVTSTTDIFGDFVVDSNDLFVDISINRVGIGTNSPSHELNVIGDTNITGDLLIEKGLLNFGVANKLTISFPDIIAVTQTFHKIETRAGASSDDVDSISGGTEGDLLILRAFDSTHTVILTEVGNLKLGATTRSLTHVEDVIMLIHNDANGWNEISFSDNTA